METGSLLVTGGAGFIGSCLVRKQLEAGNNPIVVLDSLAYAACRQSLPTRHDRLTFVEGSVCDKPLVAELLEKHRVAQVVHLAAETHVDRSIESSEAFVQNNVVGTTRLLEASLAYWRGLQADRQASFRFLHVSTDEVFGSLGEEGRFSETTCYDPSSPYSASKAAADHFVRAFFRTYRFPALVTNCSNNFGPYQFPEKLIPLMILNALEERRLPVYGNGMQVRDWLYVEDHVEALEVVLERGVCGESYNIGGDCERRNLEIVELVCEIVDRRRPRADRSSRRSLIQHVDDRPGHDVRYAIDTQKIQSELGWKPPGCFEQRLEETIVWYLDHADWVSSIGAHRQRRGVVP